MAVVAMVAAIIMAMAVAKVVVARAAGVIACNNSGYKCCGRKEGRKECHSTSRARKVRSGIVASYYNILKVSQVLAFLTLGRCSFPFYRRIEGAPRLTYRTTRVHSL